MSKKKKIGTIFTASLMIVIVIAALGFLVAHFINVSNPSYNYIQQFNHKRYYFESSENEIFNKAFSEVDYANKKENFYIMSMGNMTMLSASKSKVISFEGDKTNTSFSINKAKIILKHKMILTCNGIQFFASEIQFLNTVDKMQIFFYDGNSNLAGEVLFSPT